jgi:branched-subunit amino acid ABC-type transport system permease component
MVMDILFKVLIDPFLQMGAMPDLFVQTIWDGFVTGVLYALIALGFVLIFKASGVFNFAQGIMVVFAALTLVGLYEMGLPAPLAVLVTLGVMFVLAVAIERVVLRPNPLAPEKSEIAKAMIKERTISEISPMPAGLLNSLKAEQILDLLAWFEMMK